MTHHALVTRFPGIEQLSEHDRRVNVVVRLVGRVPMITHVRGEAGMATSWIAQRVGDVELWES